MKKHLLILGLCAAAAGTTYAQSSGGEGEDVNQYGVKVNSYPLEAKASNEILVLENREKNYKFWMDNRVQFDGATFFGLKNGMFDEETMKPVMPGGVSMRRVRSAVKAQVTEDWYGEVDLNFSDGVFELEDAYVIFSGLKNFQFQAGNFKEDFSMEETTTSRYNTFMERAMVIQAFAPGRHIGIRTQWQKWDFLRASAGVSWQLVDNAETRFNVEEYNKIGKKMGPNFTGKVVWMPFASVADKGLHIGYNVSYRNAKKTDDNFESLEEPTGRGYNGNYFSTRNAVSINRTKFISTEFYGVKHDMLHGFELAGYKDGFRAVGEFIMDKSVMDEEGIKAGKYPGVSNTESKLFYGFYAQATYLLFGGKQRYDSEASEFTQPSRGKSWGDIELMVRYDYLNLNSEIIRPGSGLYGGSGENYTLGVVYHVNNNVKMMLNYQYSRNDRYAGNKGKAYIGSDKAGNPTKNPIAVDETQGPVGARFHGLQFRVEIDF